MTIESWLIYVMLALVATATPGPAVLLIMTNASLYGFKKAVFCALGNVSGLLFLSLVTVSGLGILLISSIHVFNLVKYAGAAYLIYLGIKMFFGSDAGFHQDPAHCSDPEISSLKLYFQAFGVAVSNPKAIVFLTALFPQFLNLRHPLFFQFAILISTLMVLSFCFLTAYAFVAHKTKSWLKNTRRLRLVNRGSGAVFVGMGILLAASSNK